MNFFLTFTFENAVNIPWICYSLEVAVEVQWVSFERPMIIRNGFNLLPIFAKKALSYTFDKDPE